MLLFLILAPFYTSKTWRKKVLQCARPLQNYQRSSMRIWRGAPLFISWHLRGKLLWHRCFWGKLFLAEGFSNGIILVKSASNCAYINIYSNLRRLKNDNSRKKCIGNAANLHKRYTQNVSRYRYRCSEIKMYCDTDTLNGKCIAIPIPIL